jgi:hypothetical protein
MTNPFLEQIRHLISTRFRQKRMRDFWVTLGLSSSSTVLDVGGTEYNWTLLPERCRLTILNLSVPDERSRQFTWVVGDARHLPFKPRSFDIVYSNSVIEHVGPCEDQKLFARECRRVGQGYYVQTPNKWFFFDPHLISPFVHWLPRKMQRSLVRKFTLWGILGRPSKEEADFFLEYTHLLGETELSRLFPDASMRHEGFLRMTKSLTAVRFP